MLDLATQSLTSYVQYICTLTFHHPAGSFFAYIAIIPGHLVLLLRGKAVLLHIRTTFKRSLSTRLY